MRWFKTDVSEVPIRTTLKDQVVLLGQLDPLRWYIYVVSKRRFQTISHRVITQKEEFSLTATEFHEFAKYLSIFYLNKRGDIDDNIATTDKNKVFDVETIHLCSVFTIASIEEQS